MSYGIWLFFSARHGWRGWALAIFTIGLACAARAEARVEVPVETNKPPAAVLSPSKAQLEQWRAELAALAATNTPASDQAVADWLDKLLAGQAPREIHLEILEAARKHPVPAVGERLDRYDGLHPRDTRLARFLDLLYGGNAAAGRRIFFEKQEANCGKCHKVGDQGGEVGPPLGRASTNKLTREDILESMVSPDACAAPGYETVAVVLKDRTACTGIIKRESETELIIETPDDGKFTLKKADIALRRKGLSPMPESLWQTLSRRELRDLVEFVATLK